VAAEYKISPLSEDNAREIITWQYEPPYDLYDLAPENLPGLLNPDYRYHQVLNDDGILVGYCCFGIDAQVPGGEYLKDEPEVIDIGVGMRPSLTGQGSGTTYVREILDYCFVTYRPEVFRASIARFNQRSLNTFQNLDFKIQGNFIRELGFIEFYQLERPAKEE